MIYKAVGKSVVDDHTWNVYVDGDEQADPAIPDNDKDTDYAYTEKGATTEIYVDDVNDTVTVVMINHYMAEVTKVKDGENTVRVLSDKTMTCLLYTSVTMASWLNTRSTFTDLSFSVRTVVRVTFPFTV